jgi:lipopolysaccharide/colanic/teichoic acid biosynthesis glycosyltransferase
MAQISTPRRFDLMEPRRHEVTPARRDSLSRTRRRLRRQLVTLRLAALAMGPSLRRCLDIGVSALGLLCLLPVFLTVAGVIKLTSKGPVFFAQERVGLRGRRFRMWKFRTMVQGADALKGSR